MSKVSDWSPRKKPEKAKKILLDNRTAAEWIDSLSIRFSGR
jgi:hypothetical protein